MGDGPIETEILSERAVKPSKPNFPFKGGPSSGFSETGLAELHPLKTYSFNCEFSDP